MLRISKTATVTGESNLATRMQTLNAVHCEFFQLVDQLCAFTIDFDRDKAGYSPDRVDALVWAMTELFPGMTQAAVDISRFAITHRGKSGWMA